MSPVPEGFVPDGFVPDSSGAVPGGLVVSNEPLQRLAAARRHAAAALPAIGSLASFAVPGLGWGRLLAQAALAGAGAAAGGAGEQAMLGEQPTMENAAKRGAEYGGTALLGGALLKGATGAARGLMQSALRPTVTLQRAFEDVDLIGSALKEGVPVGSQAGKEGSKKLAVRVLKSSERLNKRLAAADAAGYRKTAADLASNAIAKAEKELGRKLTVPERKQLIVSIRDEANQLLADRRFGIAPSDKTTFSASEIKKVKQSAQNKARRIIAAEAQGVNTGASPELSRSLSKGAWHAFPRPLRPIEANTQRLKATRLALKQAEMRNPPPPAMTTWRGAMLRPIETPQFQSRAALWLNHPLTRILAAGGPRAVALTLDEMEQYDPETP